MAGQPGAIIDVPSPNFGPRRDGLRPSLVVIHYTAMASMEAARDRLCDPEAEVSAHYLISGKGAVLRLVAEEMRAWHAGVGQWAGGDDINSRSIGIELDNRGDHPFSAPQMVALEGLLRGIMGRWDIPAAGVIGHSDMAPGRKVDPGARFDWAGLARLGLAARAGVDAGPSDPEPETFRRRAQNAGYTADCSDTALLEAVRLRYRPWAKGPLCGEDYRPLLQDGLWT